jgi:hypothetical protein
MACDLWLTLHNQGRRYSSCDGSGGFGGCGGSAATVENSHRRAVKGFDTAVPPSIQY